MAHKTLTKKKSRPAARPAAAAVRKPLARGAASLAAAKLARPVVAKAKPAAVVAKRPAAKAGKPMPKAKPVVAKPASKPAPTGPVVAKVNGTNGHANGKPTPTKPRVAAPTLDVKPAALAVAPTPAKPKPSRPPEPTVTVPQIIARPLDVPPTSQKGLKNQAGLGQRDLDGFRDLLLAKRRELMGDMSSMEREALHEGRSDLSNLPVHMADQGTDAYEQEFTLGLVEKDRVLLKEINHALVKLQNGTYGLCEGTQKPITRARLEVVPWARFGIEHQTMLERRRMPMRR